MSELEFSIKIPDEAEQKSIVKRTVKRRAMKRVAHIAKYLIEMGVERFFIGGSSLRPEPPNDYDLYPINKGDFRKFTRAVPGFYNETINAKTFKFDSGRIKIQLCNFHRGKLKDLIEGYDYAHVKLGAMFQRIIDRNTYACRKIYISNDYWKSQILGRSFYCPTAESYPLNSLIRMLKYLDRGFIKHPYDVIFHILSEWLKRGYKDRVDFIDQLNAIDVSLSNINRLNHNRKALETIYSELHKPSD